MSDYGLDIIYDGTPTLGQIFEGPSDEQVEAYYKSIEALYSNIKPTDTEYLNFLQSKYQIETDNPNFDIRSELTVLMNGKQDETNKLT